ncbi:MAG TPA: VOC family protein [Tepidisphaeraceae bacterium]|nr:VOC family protein [Tepidisphaeraceae bacterium]
MRLLNIAIPSRNFEAAVGFYRDILGLCLCHEALGCCYLDAGGTNIAIHVAGEGSDFAPTGHGLYLDLAVPDFEQTRQRLLEAGILIRHEWTDDTGHVIEVNDPDGNLVEIVG